ncbi:MAG: polyprenyl diphosphate synthase [Deltaproteobacteria bacterium]|nr:polyprenyl diphosphate synthase [Deltaproteobacteria bacterium]MDZ4347630.1 polyprenyl diphosphate synthase [Candidatus Binatia bacterium]
MKFNGLDKNRLPRHVAIIMDGNGRWAKLRGKNRIEGHRRGKTSVRVIVELSRKIGIRFLSLYAFSTENWLRPYDEVDALMGLLQHYLIAEQAKMMRYGIRLLAVGDRSRLPESVRRTLEQVIEATCNNGRMTVVLALSYSGRDEIVRMARRLARAARDGQLDPDMIDDRTIAARMDTPEVPDPDLLIRTSGEMRISNFYLWQIAYSELYVTPTLWPDFREQEYLQALIDFQKRRRRFGRTDEQLVDTLPSAVGAGGSKS